MTVTRNAPHRLRPGTVVTVQMKGLFRIAHHFALVTDKTGDDGMPMVVANAIETGGPAEVRWRDFVQGRQYRAFYPSALPPQTVLYNAYAMFGTRYNLLHWNCEHFANAAHGRPGRSDQVRGGIALAALMGGLLLAAATQ
jgi:hypothetical protein